MEKFSYFRTGFPTGRGASGNMLLVFICLRWPPIVRGELRHSLASWASQTMSSFQLDPGTTFREEHKIVIFLWTTFVTRENRNKCLSKHFMVYLQNKKRTLTLGERVPVHISQGFTSSPSQYFFSPMVFFQRWLMLLKTWGQMGAPNHLTASLLKKFRQKWFHREIAHSLVIVTLEDLRQVKGQHHFEVPSYYWSLGQKWHVLLEPWQRHWILSMASSWNQIMFL